MRTTGQLLKDARNAKNFSLRKLADLTKIKVEFISAIENERWDKLPPFSTVLGFVKSISTALGVDEKSTVAFLKRDYPPKKESIAPKPDVTSRFILSPRITFAVGIGIVFAVILGYLLFQYTRFISPPTLSLMEPKDGEIVTKNTVLVSGTTDTDAKITVNNQPVITDQDGKFTVDLEVTKETNEIIVKSISRSGKETIVSRKIQVQ